MYDASETHTKVVESTEIDSSQFRHDSKPTKVVTNEPVFSLFHVASMNI